MASVTYGWAGALMEDRSLFVLISRCIMDGQTDPPINRQMDRQTNRVTYRVPCTQLHKPSNMFHTVTFCLSSISVEN